ncbi:MAG: RND transporter [Gammaproteobacteria bacterium]|nr:RND transporter [Gammaproteobacteria bacterium]MBT8134033.1 RND transporter [Gammaproteobacteria bacterium]NNJ50661.1 RND transporter [Gammaproteobacteria bacterium]
MLKYIDRIPLGPLVIITLVMALAPFSPEPHLLEKSRMLVQGELSKGIDIFDLFWHSFLIVILVIRLIRLKQPANDL